MLHLFYGNDTIAVRQKSYDFMNEEAQKGVKIERLESDNYIKGVFTDIVGAVSLFGDKALYIIDTPSEQAEMYDDVIDNLEAFYTSENTFIIIEKALLASHKKKFQKYTEIMEEYKVASNERFNAFGMADSLARKDKKTLWLQLQEARQSGLSAEEIIGVLWWQLKSIRLATITKTANEAGMKDFPYNKAKSSLRNFKNNEINKLSRSLLIVYHDGHLGKIEIDIALESWILSL